MSATRTRLASDRRGPWGRRLAWPAEHTRACGQASRPRHAAKARINPTHLGPVVVLVACTLLASCSGPVAWQRDADPERLATTLPIALQDPDRADEARRQLGWLCLLHDRGCPAAFAALATGDPAGPRDEAALLRALLRDGHPDPGLAARAWLDVAATEGELGGDPPLATAALARAAALAEQMDASTARALAEHPAWRSAWTTGSARDRLLRALAWPRLAPVARAPVVLRQGQVPLSRRLHAALPWNGEGLRTAVAEPLPATAAVELPDESSGSAVGTYTLVAHQPGVYRVAVALAIPAAGRWTLGVVPPGAARAWLDGQPWPAAEVLRGATAADVALAAGSHALELAVAVGEEGERLRLLLAPAVAPTPLSAPAAPDPQGPPVAALRALVADPAGNGRLLWQALSERNLAVDLVQLAFATGPMQVGSAIDRVVTSLPEHVGAILLDIERQQLAGNAQLALQQAGRLPGPTTGGGWSEGQWFAARDRLDVHLARARALQAAGLADLAVSHAGAALAGAAGRCRPWLDALAIAVDAGRGHDLWRPGDAEALRSGCRDEARLPNGLFAVRSLQAAHASAADLDAWLGPPATRPARWRLEVPGQDPGVAPQWATQGQWAPIWRAVQAAWLQGESGRAQALLDGALLRPDLPIAAKQKALQAGATVPWTPFVRDGLALARLPDNPAWATSARTAWLLDQEILVLLPGGGAVRRVHQIARVLSDEAAEAVGEVHVAEGAELELARTLLPDGSAVPPADISDKSAISLRAVAAGCAVEYAQVAWTHPDDPASGATWHAPFLLQSADSPVRASEFVVLVPAGLAVQFDRSPGAPVAKVVPAGAWTAHVFALRDLPAVAQEPRAIRPERLVPSVTVRAQASLPALVEPWDERLAAALAAASPAARQWLSDLLAVAAGADGLQRWQHLARRIAREIEHDHAGGPPGDPNAAIAQQKGDRAAVFYALARLAGADACLVRANALVRDGASDPPDPADYAMELVTVALPDGASLWYDPGLEGGVLDHVRSGLRGRRALLVGCGRAQREVTVPALGVGRDRRDIAVNLQWAGDGAITGTVTETLHGATAAYVGQWLAEVPASEHSKLPAQLASGVFPGLELAFGASRHDPVNGNLQVTYSVHGKADPSRTRMLDLGLYPSEIGKTYAVLERRRTPMSFGFAQDLRIQLTVHGGAEPILAPTLAAADHPLLAWSRCARAVAGGVVVEFALRAEAGVVTPSDYPAFARAARGADAAEILRLYR